MRRTVGAMLFVLGACAPATNPGSPAKTLETGPFERSAPYAHHIPRNDLAGGRELERARRIGSPIFETAFELCAASSDDANAAHQAADTVPRSDCRYRLEIEPNSLPKASIRGSRIRLTQGMVRFAKGDAELAFVLAHEIAHGLLGHGSAPFWKSRKSIELEADRMGLQLMARAGYPVEPAADLLGRMAGALPRAERPDPSYPSYNVRVAAVRSMIRELRHLPDRKE